MPVGRRLVRLLVDRMDSEGVHGRWAHEGTESDGALRAIDLIDRDADESELASRTARSYKCVARSYTQRHL